MIRASKTWKRACARWGAVLAACWAAPVFAFNLTVVDGDGNAITNGYRWLIEEDTTYHPEDVDFGRDPDTLGLSFHSSYMPVVAKGTDADIAAFVVPDSTKHYFISVLPDQGTTNYSIGGARILPGQDTVEVTVQSNPIPTAQITFFVFDDTFPVNGQPDLPEEEPNPLACDDPTLGNCMAGFKIIIEDAGGRYGASAGRQSQDAFGNPIGTTYLLDTLGNVVLDATGNPTVAVLGDGVVYTDATGHATVKYLAPGKYGTIIVPPVGQTWQQTTTIEGTKVIDAWVKANEPPYFAEFGPVGVHVFAGFVKPFTDNTVLSGGQTITGTVVNAHMSRPPDYQLYEGFPFDWTTPWVGLTDLNLAGPLGKTVYVQPTNNGSFAIPNVPPGNYSLTIFDNNLDLVIAQQGLTVNNDNTCTTPNLSCNLGNVGVFNWFARFESHVFDDLNENGFWDLGEEAMPNVAINLRWRDGTVYQSVATDTDGFAPFDQVFPFFHWLVAEVDFAAPLKATGATFVVDAGGAVGPDNGWTYPSFNVLNPQAQCADDNSGTGATVPYNPATGTCPGGSEAVNPLTGNNLSRTEVGPVLTQGFQAFLGQTNVIQWGKAQYGHSQNGGISGIVFYSTTRAENDPELGAAEPWEPGIPRVTVNLYQDADGDGLPDTADPIMTTETDSWDANLPTGCQGESFYAYDADTGLPIEPPLDCYDGLRNFNQLRPGVFDGGYAFGPWIDCPDTGAGPTCPPFAHPSSDPVEEAAGIGYLNTGNYIVEVVPPAGYEIVKSQDKNVDFGDTFVASPLLTPPACVGTDYVVPAELSLFPGVPAPLAGSTLPLCDRKQVVLPEKANAAADFFLFTEVPIAGHFVGMILDDTANEFNPASPQFGEKYAPPFLPVAFRDWTGKEIVRVYADEWGRYNGLIPSTYTENLPQPSGISPAMLTACMNDPGPIPDPNNPGQMITDPHFNVQYSQFCYTFQYMPGATTYLDTPVVPVAAFAGPDQFQLDCEFGDGTPVIKSVHATGGNGPILPGSGGGLTITSVGTQDVPNPAYDGPNGLNLQTITRDFTFGADTGTVTIGGVPVNVTSWTPLSITVGVPGGTPSGDLVVTRGDNGQSTVMGVTVTVETLANQVLEVSPGVNHNGLVSATPIQDAIDAALPGQTILVTEGNYNEMVVMWKPVRLQGVGAGSTSINASLSLSNRLQDSRADIERLVTQGLVDLLPAQEIGFGGVEPVTLFTEEGAGVLVLARNDGSFAANAARIDGLTIQGSASGGGIVVNGYADGLEIANNRIMNNQGFFNGGIRVGHPELILVEANGDQVYQDAFNDNVSIHHNYITRNGGLNGAGGGVSLHTGSDDYRVSQNFVCGNFTSGHGGGIGHMGLVQDVNGDGYGGRIEDNTLLFNQSFFQGAPVHGGGIYVAGGAPLVGMTTTPGSGSVLVDTNLIKGNLAGAGDGGGIRLSQVNGQDVEAKRNDVNAWYKVDVLDNMIVNNVAGMAGGGLSVQDTIRARVMHNVIANNDSTATAGAAFTPGNPNASNPQPAGVVAYAFSPALADTIGNSNGSNNQDGISARTYKNKGHADPRLVDDIIWQNRSFSVEVQTDPVNPDVQLYVLVPDVTFDPAVYDDLAVLGTLTPGCLTPNYSILTDPLEAGACTGVNNLSADPLFVKEYVNGSKSSIQQVELKTTIAIQPAVDEGGNFIDVRFGPLSESCLVDPNADGSLPGDWAACGDYHIQTGSPAANAGGYLRSLATMGVAVPLATDYDGEPRPVGTAPDIGADELQ